MKVDAVLPLVRADVARARILLASLEKYFGILGTLWVVTPAADVDAVRRRLGGRDRYRVLAETELIPELDGREPPPSGWSVQQLVKLAIASRIGTDFYVTFDADVICIGDVAFEDLVLAGRAVSNRRDEAQFRPEWYDWAERVLELPRSGYVHGVTPAVLNKEAVLRLAAFLGAKTSRFPRLARLFPAVARKGWRGYLLDNLPWTEYTLYFTYLEATGRYADYHFPGDAGKDTIYGNSIWVPEQSLDDWDPDRVFEQPVPYRFVVIQSNHPDISVEDVWEKVGRYLAPPEDMEAPPDG